LQRALSLTNGLGEDPRELDAIARCHMKIAALLDGVFANQKEARKHFELGIQIAESIPTQAGIESYKTKIYAYNLQGGYDLFRDPLWTIKLYRRSSDLGAEWASQYPSAEARRVQAISIRGLGIASLFTGDVLGAITYFEQCEMLFKQSIEQVKLSDNRTLDLAKTYIYHAYALGNPDYANVGRWKEASDIMQKSLAITDQLATMDPNDVNLQFVQSTTLAELAACRRIPDPRGAERLYREWLSKSEALLASYDNDDKAGKQRLERLGFVRLLRDLGKRKEALFQAQIAVSAFEVALRKHPSSRSHLEGFANSLNELAIELIAIGAFGQARKLLEKACDSLGLLHLQTSSMISTVIGLSTCYEAFGNLTFRENDWREARSWYQKSLELWEAWPRNGASSVYDQKRRDQAIGRIALAQKHIQSSRP